MRTPHGILYATAVVLLAPLAGAAVEPPDFLRRIESTPDLISVTIPSSAPLESRVGKFLLPARDDAALLEPLFQNVNLHVFHFEFLSAVFPDRFSGLTFPEYMDLVMRRTTRDYYAGTLTQYVGPGDRSYGFDVLTDGSNPDELLEPGEVRAVYERLRGVFELAPLEYAPQRAAAILAARSWENPGFPIRNVGDQELPRAIGYSPATNYGVVRSFTLAELAVAEAAGALDGQTIAIVDDAPTDLETAVAGLVTGTPQGELSHLATRLARRGVPNVFVRDATQEFEPFANRLVRLDVSLDDFSVREASVEEAEAWWAEHRPSVPPIPDVDGEYSGLDRITEIALDDPAGGAIGRFGGKAAGLAILYRYLPARNQTRGFAIPFRYYLEFMRGNTISSLADPAVQVSYEDHVEELLADTRFRADGAFRRAALKNLRDHMREHGTVPEELRDALRERILEVFDDPEVKVRFRSSSNNEDSPEVTGAGLYDSTSVCLPDELDGDDSGPSRCDPSKRKERTIERALKKVWASLWNHRAFEERQYFQIDHRRSAMALAVTLAYPAEDVNGVLFTGSPANRHDRRHVVNVQLGDESVVSPGVGIESEKDLLVMDGDRLRKVVRARASSLTVPGQHVLSDEQLRELGETLAPVVDDFLGHYDLGDHPRDEVLVDFEFKFQDGQLIVKQARPFLRSDTLPPGLLFAIDVAPSVTMCARFQDDRPPYDEYRLKSRVQLAAGRIELPARAVHVFADVIERLEFGPDRQVLEPLNSGLFELNVRFGRFWSWDYTQDFDLDGQPFRVRFSKIFNVERGEFEWSIDEDTPGSIFIFGEDWRADPPDLVQYGSCHQRDNTLWEITAEFEGGDRARFLKRFDEPVAGSAPVVLTLGEARLAGVEYSETSYWRLVYAAAHHNFFEHFVLVFDPPITVGETSGVAGLQLREEFRGTPAAAALVDEEFNVLRTLEVLRYSEEPFEQPTARFVRGNANGDGAVDLSDAVAILGHLFLGGPTPGCLESADANDSGGVDLSDAVYLLSHLFLGGPAPPSPFPECHSDATGAPLGCAQSEPCADVGGIALDVAPDLDLFSIWSEGYDTA
ncbi:MAG: hypothetical protein O7J95_04785, partial [Planctomycetota bacterium]|nr:hypothetical protein [Planctomycetota bacterium]